MVLESHKTKRALAIIAGVTAIAAGAALNVTHLVEGGQPLFSPMTAAIVALALGAVAAALIVSEAWRAGRRALASCLVLSIVASEGFGLIMGAERLLFAREERQRAASEVNTGRWIATVRVESASTMLAVTEAALLMDCRLTQLRQTAGEVTATFSNGRTATGEVLVGADGINSATLQLAWPNPRPKRWTEVTCFRGLIPRTVVASLRKADGSPLDHNPINSFSMDRHRNDRSGATTYWVRGGELLNVWIARYEPDSAAFEQEEGDWFPVSQEEILREVGEAFTGSADRDDLLALAGAIVRPTKWGLYDRDALETWVQGRICLLGDAAHPMLPTFGQGAAQSFEDAAALASAFALHGRDVATAMLHYERVRHYRATRFQLGSKFAFDHLRAKDTAAQKALLETLDERVSPAFAHDKRGGEDDSWIYAYDARNIGAELPPKRLGPWDFRRAAKADYAAITRKLWMPAAPAEGTRPVTREEVALHNTRDDCWIIISGKVYDITEWAPHHPGGAGIARMYAGKEATAEFGDYHSAEAVAHMAHFCIGDFVETPTTLPDWLR